MINDMDYNKCNGKKKGDLMFLTESGLILWSRVGAKLVP